MAHKIEIKEHAQELRREGYSIKEIADLLKISKTTSSTWCSGIQLNKSALERLAERKILGQYKAIQISTRKRELAEMKRVRGVNEWLRKVKLTKEVARICCSLLSWCEGSKSRVYVKFMNSDPSLIRLFLKLFRYGFILDESKFRALIHLHEYHDEEIQKIFWSNKTGIPLKQFHKSYIKSHTGKRKRENYPGCISIAYYDADLAKELYTIYNVFTQRGVG